jgi:hypothetical protein
MDADAVMTLLTSINGYVMETMREISGIHEQEKIRNGSIAAIKMEVNSLRFDLTEQRNFCAAIQVDKRIAFAEIQGAKNERGRWRQIGKTGLENMKHPIVLIGVAVVGLIIGNVSGQYEHITRLASWGLGWLFPL